MSFGDTSVGESLTRRLWVYVLPVAAAVTGGTLAAQTPRQTFSGGLSAGAAVHSGPVDLSRLGPAASAFVRWRTAPRVAFALEALITTFSKSSDVIYGPCPPEPESCSATASGTLTVGALATTVHWDDSTVAAGKRGSYLILGGGFYRALSHPTARGATRLGWTAGFGFLFSPAKPRVALEVRYHQIPRWPGDRISLIPVTIAFSR